MELTSYNLSFITCRNGKKNGSFLVTTKDRGCSPLKSMNQSSCFVTKIDLVLAPKLKEILKDQGFELLQPPYTLFQGKKKGISCTLYQSGKLVVQGKEKAPFITYCLETDILPDLPYTYPEAKTNTTPHIGIDEAGKGDFFGPLCIAAVYADKTMIETLIKMGISDSKRFRDPSIAQFAQKIKKECPHSIIQIFPKRYNQLYNQYNNLNHLLASAHVSALEEMIKKTGCKTAIIDQFAHKRLIESILDKQSLSVDLTQRHRGEEDIVVAAASILARNAFVQAIEMLSSQFNLLLPKGASSFVIQAGKRFVLLYGKNRLNEVAKLHFKTTSAI